MIQLTKTVEVALTVTLDAYAQYDVVGGLIPIPLHSAGCNGTIRRIKLVDDANQKEPYKLYIFDRLPSTIANDAAFAPAIADLKAMIDKVTIAAADYETLVNASAESNAIAIIGGHTDDVLAIDYETQNGNLYAYLVAQDTPDYAAAADLTLEVTAWVN